MMICMKFVVRGNISLSSGVTNFSARGICDSCKVGTVKLVEDILHLDGGEATSFAIRKLLIEKDRGFRLSFCYWSRL